MNCSNCSKELTPVPEMRMRRRDDFPQYQDSLVINFQGGYGMFIDEPIDNLVVCSDCATKILRSFEAGRHILVRNTNIAV